MYLIEILHQTTTYPRAQKESPELYLIEILHQTTTKISRTRDRGRCILSKFYIKPQQYMTEVNETFVVSYRNSTSNHNWKSSIVLSSFVVSYRNSTSNHNNMDRKPYASEVVSYRNSTSNHNTEACFIKRAELYLIEILHQTTTSNRWSRPLPALYLIEILHQTTTGRLNSAGRRMLYLIEILHQTTTDQPRTP